jgi:hypothetical protein
VVTEQFAKEGSGTDNKTCWELTLHNGTSLATALKCTSAGKILIGLTASGSTDSKLQVTGGTTNATNLATSYSNASVAIVPKSSSGYSLAIASGTSDSPLLQVSANGVATGELLIQPYGGNTMCGGRLTVTTSGADGIVIANDTATPANSGRVFFTNNTSGQGFALFNAAGTQLNFNYGAVPGSSSGSLTAMFLTSTGNLTIAGTFTESSSIVLKENVNPITNALDAVMQLVGVTYDRKNGSSKNEAGLIAEDVDKILPNLVSHKEDGSAEGIHYTKLTAYLIEAVKALKAEIDELKGTK